MALPADDTDLETAYSGQNYLDVDTKDNVRVDQTATDQYAIHQFKDFVGATNSCILEWEGQSSLAPTDSMVVLQIYNRVTTTWLTVDFNNSSSANMDFILTASIPDLTSYKNASDVISCRVWQLNT